LKNRLKTFKTMWKNQLFILYSGKKEQRTCKRNTFGQPCTLYYGGCYDFEGLQFSLLVKLFMIDRRFREYEKKTSHFACTVCQKFRKVAWEKDREYVQMKVLLTLYYLYQKTLLVETWWVICVKVFMQKKLEEWGLKDENKIQRNCRNNTSGQPCIVYDRR